MQKFRPAIILGLAGAFITILFGGWGTLVMALLMSALTGIRYGTDSKSRDPRQLAQEATQPGLIASFITALGGALHVFVIRPMTGKAIQYELNLNFGDSQARINGLLVLAIVSVVSLIVGPLVARFMASRQGLPNAARRRHTLFALAVFLVVFPFYEQTTDMRWMAALITVQIFSLLALGLNIVVGYAGLLDLGYAAFFAIGAYTTGLLNSPQIDVHWNFWLIIWIAAAVAAVAGLILGAPTLPLRGDYLAIVTLGFGEIVPIVFRNLIAVTLHEPITGYCLVGCDPVIEIRNACFYACTGPLDLTAGEKGINPIGRPPVPFLDNLFDRPIFGANFVPWYFLVLGLIIFSIFIIRRMRDSRLGRAWMAIREDELAASQMGIDPVKTKLMAFAMGATFSGFAGAFYGSYISGIFPSVFDFSVSVIILCMVILGGLGNMTGVLIGSLLIMGTDRLLLPQIATVLKGFMTTSVLPNVGNEALRDFLATSVDPIQMRLALFGIVLVVMMLVRPEGLVPSAERKAELHEADAEPVDDVLAEASAQ